MAARRSGSSNLLCAYLGANTGPKVLTGQIRYGLPADVPTFGGRATLVTSASVDTRVVAVVAKEVLGHLAELRTLHPALARLRPSQMVNDGLTAPLHPAAEQVYRGMGLIE